MEIAALENCCGCGNCALVCKQNAIVVDLDPTGFYKRIIDDSKCINCHACELVCPMTADTLKHRTTLGIKAFYASISDPDVLKAASSGGIASAIAAYWLHGDNSVVYGSQYAPDHYGVKTVRVSSFEELRSLYGSKYVQSWKGDIFQSVKDDLMSGLQVLYIGLPCDIAALKLFVRKDYANLFTCELVCHGTTSTTALKQYIDIAKEKYHSEIASINMRYKKGGRWTPYYFAIKFQDGKEYLRNFWESDFGFAFSRFRNSSCYTCPFKSENRCADITLGDAWGAPEEVVNANQSGISSVLLNTTKGIDLFDTLIKNGEIRAIETSKESIVKGNPNLSSSEAIPADHGSIGEEICNNGLTSAVRKFRPFRSRMIITVKRILRKS